MRLGAVCLVTLAACGRLGFDDGDRGTAPPDGPPDEPVEPGPVDVLVASSESGIPVDGAYVVFIAEDGTTEILETGPDGGARTQVTGATTVHVAFIEPRGLLGAPGDVWRVASFYEVGGGTSLRLGAPVRLETPQSMTITLPDAGATEYSIVGPEACVLVGSSSSARDVSLTFTDACSGRAVPLFAATNTDQWLELGTHTLVPGGTVTIPAVGGWQPSRMHRIRITGTTGTAIAAARLAAVRGGQEVPFGQLEGSETTMDAISVVGPDVAIDRMLVGVQDVYVPGVFDRALYIANLEAPPEVAGERVVDVAVMPPAPRSVALDAVQATGTWSYDRALPDGAVTGVFFSFPLADGSTVEWRAFAPAAVTSYQLPRLPPPLAHLVPAADLTFDFGVLLAERPGLGYRDTLADVDVALWSLAIGALALMLPPDIRIALGGLDQAGTD